MFTPATDNCIKKLRIVGEVDDSLAFQLRLQSLLSSTDFSIPGVSPAAVVCVRSLPDPRPGTLRLARSELEGGGAWAKALTESLAGKVNRAARPADGFVPSNAECVLFADRAEMLACLARDWLRGSLWTRWWWKILLPAGDSSEIVKRLWRDHPQYVPAALDRLEREGEATSFVNALTDDECHELLQHTVRGFAIHELGHVCEVSFPFDCVNVSEISTDNSSRVDIDQRAVEQKFLAAPWQKGCGEQVTRDVSPERQLFLGVMLTIVRAPAYARSREFARAIERWQEEINNRIQSPKTNLPPSKQAQDDRQISSAAVIESGKSEIDRTVTPSKRISQPAEPETEQRPLARNFESRRQIEPAGARPTFNDSNAVSERGRPLAVDVDDEPLELVTETRPEFASDTSSRAAEPFIAARESAQPVNSEAVVEAAWVEIETQLGGLFYLINLALYLNLYGDFTMPSAPQIDLNIWDFVSLVGKDLIGDEDGEDPIWQWLAVMSGREESQSAEDACKPQDERPLPPELSLLMPSLRTRLREALGSQSDEEAAVTLCRHYARVRVTETHVDVFFALADLPLEIRFAGLDRDPGWVPAAGRFIAFHFD